MDWQIVRSSELEDCLNVSRFTNDIRKLNRLGAKLSTIKEVCFDSCCGATPKGSQYVEDGVILLRGGNVKENGIVWNDIVRFQCNDIKSLGRSQVKDNDVLVCMSGANAGDVCFAGELKEFCSLSNTVFRIEFNRANGWDAEFVSIFLISRLGQAQFEKALTGMAQKHVMPSTIRNVKVPVYIR